MSIQEAASAYSDVFLSALGYRAFVEVKGERIHVRNKTGAHDFSESEISSLTSHLAARLSGPVYAWSQDGYFVGCGTEQERDQLVADGIYGEGEIVLGKVIA